MFIIKKIAITTNKMIMGGIEKALLEMINNMREDEYEITLFLKSNGGELIDSVPSRVKKIIIFEENISTKNKIKRFIKRKQIIKAFKVGFYTLMSSRSTNFAKSYKYICKTLDRIDEEYDLAISYSTPTSFSVVYTIDKIKAKKKAVWIHSDLDRYKELIKDYEEYYAKYDQVYSVSNVGCKKIADIFPGKIKSVSTFYNIISQSNIQLQAEKGDDFKDYYDGIRIVTVGRLSYEKGQDIVINIVKELKLQEYNVRWYLIGDGEEYKSLEKNIKDNNLEEDIILMGNKENPYGYIKDCHIYVQPSIQEGYCMTVSEARCLNKPMIITDFNGSYEQINNMKTGIIVERDEKQLINAIKLLIDDKHIMEAFKNNLELNEVDTKKEMDKIKALLN